MNLNSFVCAVHSCRTIHLSTTGKEADWAIDESLRSMHGDAKFIGRKKVAGWRNRHLRISTLAWESSWSFNFQIGQFRPSNFILGQTDPRANMALHGNIRLLWKVIFYPWLFIAILNFHCCVAVINQWQNTTDLLFCLLACYLSYVLKCPFVFNLF